MGIDNGTYNGINYYQNTGSLDNPVFENYTPEFFSGDYDENGNEITTKSLGGIHLGDSTYLTSYTAPYIFEHNNIYHLAIGTESGLIYLYNNVETIIDGLANLNLDTEYNLITNNMLDINNCVHSKATISDLNNDEIPDLIRGNASGGIELFIGENFNTDNNTYSNKQINIQPNPNNGHFMIQKPDDLNYQLTIYSNIGHTIFDQYITNQITNINLNNQKPGLYILQLQNKHNLLTSKVIVN